MRRIIATLLVAIALVSVPSLAQAIPPPTTSTTITKDGVSSFHQIDPCLGPTSVTLSFNSVIHATEITSGPNAGATHLAFAQAGTILLDPDDTSLPEFTGRFSIKGGFNANRSTTSWTVMSVSVARAADGSFVKLHLISHVLVTPDGVETSFASETVNCATLAATA